MWEPRIAPMASRHQDVAPVKLQPPMATIVVQIIVLGGSRLHLSRHDPVSTSQTWLCRPHDFQSTWAQELHGQVSNSRPVFLPQHPAAAAKRAATKQVPCLAGAVMPHDVTDRIPVSPNLTVISPSRHRQTRNTGVRAGFLQISHPRCMPN